MSTKQHLHALTQCALLCALGAVLAQIKLYDLPLGGSITLCSMLRIPVTMHNVPDEQITRPHTWAAFGTEDTQAADYAACREYGPLYG